MTRQQILSLLAFFTLLAPAALSQTAPPPAFDVASVRPSKPGSSAHANISLDSGYVYGTINPENARAAAHGSLIATHQALWRYIAFAYKLDATQEMALRFSIYSGVPKSGAPFWVTGSFDASPEYFDISARAPEQTTPDQLRLMMRTLLADRFHLALHYQTADAPVFALSLIRPGLPGPSLRPHPSSDPCSSTAAQEPLPAQPFTAPSPIGDLPPLCGIIAHVPASSPGQHFAGRAVSLPLLATTLPTMTGLAAIPRPVVDQTGLTGLYDFTLNWTHDPSGDEAVSDNIANFRAALKTQLGLQLKPSHAPLPFLIVDHVEHPTEN